MDENKEIAARVAGLEDEIDELEYAVARAEVALEDVESDLFYAQHKLNNANEALDDAREELARLLRGDN